MPHAIAHAACGRPARLAPLWPRLLRRLANRDMGTLLLNVDWDIMEWLTVGLDPRLLPPLHEALRASAGAIQIAWYTWLARIPASCTNACNNSGFRLCNLESKPF
jgi:hypothetical protein